MIIYTNNSVQFSINGKFVTSEGPYGYVILGLNYKWDDCSKVLKIYTVELIKVDMKLRYSVDGGMYRDIYERLYSDIYVKNGTYYYNDIPIINYGLLNIPEVLKGFVEKNSDRNLYNMERRFYNKRNVGNLMYSINPICTGKSAFDTIYRELYACIFSFDAKTLTASGIGFDVLGKLMPFNSKCSLNTLYKGLINTSRLEDRLDAEEYARAKEFNFLNLYCTTDENGNNVYSYTSIWDEINTD